MFESAGNQGKNEVDRGTMQVIRSHEKDKKEKRERGTGFTLFLLIESLWTIGRD